jgi:hypothetical protein
MNCFKFLLIVSLLFIIPELVQAQNLEKEIESEKKKIDEFFFNNMPWKTTPDSNMLIGFSFKISVTRNTDGQLKPISIIANDKIAYKIYPKYEFLKTINYELFLKDKKEAIFIIPTFIEITDSKSDTSRNYLMNFYNKSIFGGSMRRAVQSMFYMDQPKGNNNLENYIYLSPNIVAMDKRIVE